GLFSAGDVVRVMTRGAAQRSAAFLKACRSPQAVCGADDFELVVTALQRGMIEEQHEFRQRLTRFVGKCAPLVALDGIWQTRAGGLEVALHAHFHLWLRAEPRRIDDGIADVLRLCSSGPGQLNEFAARTVASAAIDTFGHRGGEHRLGARRYRLPPMPRS